MPLRSIDPRGTDFSWYAGGGDAIAQIAMSVAEEALNEILRKSPASHALNSVEGIADDLGLTPGFLWRVLFNTRLWPRNLSGKEKNGLNMVREMYQIGGAPLRAWVPRTNKAPDVFPGVPLDDANPTDVVKVSTEALKRLAVYGRGLKHQATRILFQNARVKAPRVLNHCEEILGESCTSQEAIEILIGDMRKLASYGRLGVPQGNLFQIILA